MSGFTKLDAGIVDSSIWSEDSDTRVVWITLLAKADQHGIVNAAPSALARAANVSMDACNRALDRFQQPDKESRTPDNEGRRLAKTEDGWLILNHGIYRAKEYAKPLSDDPEAVATRERVRRYREKQKALQQPLQQALPPVTEALHYASASASDNSSLKRKPDSKEAVIAYAVELGLPASDGESVWDKWQGNGFTNGGKPMKDWRAVLRSWKGYGYLPSQKQSKGQPNSRTKGTFNEGKASQYANGYS
jgi:hypothetical protein